MEQDEKAWLRHTHALAQVRLERVSVCTFKATPSDTCCFLTLACAGERRDVVTVGRAREGGSS